MKVWIASPPQKELAVNRPVHRPSFRWLSAVVAVAAMLAAGQAAAQPSPAGTYRSPNASLRLMADGNATLSGDNGPLSIGPYRIVGDTIALRDGRGQAVCGGEPGLYLWRVDADTLRLRVVNDACEQRRFALDAAWTRGFVAGQALAGVMITAERLTQDLLRAPLAVAVVSAEVVRDANVTRPQDLTNLVPGLLVGSLNG